MVAEKVGESGPLPLLRRMLLVLVTLWLWMKGGMRRVRVCGVFVSLRLRSRLAKRGGRRVSQQQRASCVLELSPP